MFQAKEWPSSGWPLPNNFVQNMAQLSNSMKGLEENMKIFKKTSKLGF